MKNLEMLAEISTQMGWPVERRTAPGPYDCPTHGAPLAAHQISTFSGWQEIVACPDYDGTCGYSPDADPYPIEDPTETADDPVVESVGRP